MVIVVFLPVSYLSRNHQSLLRGARAWRRTTSYYNVAAAVRHRGVGDDREGHNKKEGYYQQPRGGRRHRIAWLGSQQQGGTQQQQQGGKDRVVVGQCCGSC